jgi:chromosome segregation ATPase
MRCKASIRQCLKFFIYQSLLLRNLAMSAALSSLCLYSSLVWAESHSTEEGVDAQLNVGSELMAKPDVPGQPREEVSQQSDHWDVLTHSLERVESVLQKLQEVLDHNTKRLTVVEEGLLESNAEKEIEINRLNAALAAMIVEAENANKVRVDLESRIQQVVSEQEQVLGRMTDSLNSAQSKTQSMLTEKQGLVSQHKLVLAEKDAEIASLKKDLSEAKLLVKGLENENQQRATELKSTSEKLHNMTQKLEASVSDFGALEQTLTQTQVDLVNVTDRETVAAQTLSQIEEEKRHLQNQLDLIRARLPAAEGGLADIASIREQAAELGNFYREAYSTATKQDSAAQSAEIDSQLEQRRTALMAEQMLLGRLLAGRGIYTIKPDDSLSSISYAVYGVSNFWPKIFKTNSHILSSPDQLVPGLPLVIP